MLAGKKLVIKNHGVTALLAFSADLPDDVKLLTSANLARSHYRYRPF